MAESEVAVRPTAEAVAELAAAELVAHLGRALKKLGRASLALSGGSTPRCLYRRLAGECDSLEWVRIDLFQTDERCVPPDDEQSNYRLIRECLTDRIGRPGPRFHRVRGELPAGVAARRYAALLDRHLEGAPPRLDAVVLGVGTDGHTASIFPERVVGSGSGRVSRQGEEPWVLATRSPAGPRNRVSLSLQVLRAAGLRVVLMTGASKRGVAERLLGSRRDLDLPAARLAGSVGRTLWVLDEEAAADLVVA